jgi:hypothetical protein
MKRVTAKSGVSGNLVLRELGVSKCPVSGLDAQVEERRRAETERSKSISLGIVRTHLLLLVLALVGRRGRDESMHDVARVDIRASDLTSVVNAVIGSGDCVWEVE